MSTSNRFILETIGSRPIMAKILRSLHTKRRPHFNHADAPITSTFPSGSGCEIAGIMLRNRCWATTFHTITGVKTDRCDQPLSCIESKVEALPWN